MRFDFIDSEAWSRLEAAPTTTAEALMNDESRIRKALQTVNHVPLVTNNDSSFAGHKSRVGSRESLLLLGTVHSDHKGFSRTRAFLELYRPDLILVEISDFALNFRKRRSFELRKIFLERLRTVSRKMKIEFEAALRHVQIASILRQIRLPYEYRASAAYAKRTGIDLIAVDYSEFSREWIGTWPEMISAENLERLLEIDNIRAPVSSLYAQAARRICGESFLPEAQFFDAVRWQQRENLMASQIASALERLGPERPVYIGGWWHLCSGGKIKTIRELLGIGKDCCVLLDRAAAGRRVDAKPR